ncbi:hypothetical protein [Serratia quinivorans]|uniref:hypothetical protein n=2 Tax=Serratia quinivorans TaxID=137545 RepID=UPI0021B7383F|nr:hypothetical protein [Serratia quinivorans]
MFSLLRSATQKMSLVLRVTPAIALLIARNPSVAGFHLHSRNYYKLHPLGEFFDEGERSLFGVFGRGGQFQCAVGNPANTLVIAQSIDDADSFDPVQGFELTTVQFGLMF